MTQPTKQSNKHKPQGASKKQNIKSAGHAKQPYIAALLGVLIISFIAYLPALQNHFVWDDEKYVVDNVLIHSINLKNLFSSYVMGNYHPLTMLLYAIEYRLFGLSEEGFHFVNLLLHLANVVLVFYIILSLTDKVMIAITASLLFGIHPLHVESVAWVSQLKDLLYAFFFLASYICYILYLRQGKRKYYIYCLLLFVLSLLSKAMAASLPAVLLLTDYLMPQLRNASLKEGKHKINVWVEKIPFFLVALILGLVAVSAQKSAGAVEAVSFPFDQRIVFACYGFISYLIKIVLPLDLSAFYNYPIQSGEAMPAQYYIYVVLFLALIGYAIYSLRFTKKILFGIGFYAITVFLVLQLLPIGKAIMADRYSYIPSIGIFYLAAEGVYWLWNKRPAMRTASIVLTGCFTIFFTVETYSRCRVWTDASTLWSDVIIKSPDAAVAYYNLAIELKDKGKFDEALVDFNKTIELDPQYESAYNNRGIIMSMKKNYADAIKDFTKAMDLKPGSAEVYGNRGLCYQNNKQFEEAIKDYNKSIELDHSSPLVFYNRGVIEFNSGQKEKACADFHEAASLNFPLADNALKRLCH